jgi:DNA invertase Pin-like site-specific DNA recombinase
MKVGGYMRVSAVNGRDVDRWLTVPFQEAAIRRWCAESDAALVELRQDLDRSGGDERPNLEALVAMVETGNLDAIVVGKLDRFARSMRLGVNMIHRVEEAGGSFIAVDDGFDLRRQDSKLLLHSLLMVADHQLVKYKEGWRRARETMILERGQHYGPTIPLGYARGADGVLIADPVTAPLVRTLFERRAAGESYSTLARWLEGLGIRTWRGGIPGRRFVREICTRRVYLGEAYAGKLVNPVAHEPLVDLGLWMRVQGSNGVRPARSESAPAALAGLLRCQGCRYSLSTAWSVSSAGRSRAYRCRADHAAGRCPAPAFVLERDVLGLVENAFWQRIEAMEATATKLNRNIDKLTVKRDQARTALEAFRDDPEIIEVLGISDFKDGLRARQERLHEAEQAFAHENCQRASNLPPSHELKRDWKLIDAMTKRRMYAQVFDSVIVSKPRVHRSHSEPLAGRIGFLLSGASAGMDLPKPGANPTELRSFNVGHPADAWLALL